jgi:hypothetical protein
MPATQKIRTPAARTQSTNNLKVISLGMQSFHDFHKRLPFNGNIAAVANDSKSGSWGFQILPFVDNHALFADPNLKDEIVQAYCCPQRGRPGRCTTGPWSDYCINPWLNDPKNGAANAPDRKLTLLGITDDGGNTIFAGQGMIDPNRYASKVAIPQSTDIFKGGDPALARTSTVNQVDRRGDGSLHWGGPFSQGTLFAFCDGTVRMFPYTISGGVIRNGVGDGGLAVLLTPAGNEKAELPD